ncbi:JAB domain-containing protein [Halomonas sp.]|uniref:JAB domain-containing protein n=1 Tax=unclassified Halomonas TaxID=2609666 RepID=UPI003F8D72AC
MIHHHPSGDPEPSGSDRQINERLKEAPGLMDIKVIDHVVVGSDGCKSFAKMGYL